MYIGKQWVNFDFKIVPFAKIVGGNVKNQIGYKAHQNDSRNAVAL